MKKQLIKRVVSCFMAVAMIVSCFMGMGQNAEAAPAKVIPSDVNYSITMDNTTDLFIYNKESIGTKVGTEYFFTYTVESMKVQEHRLQGIIGTNVPVTPYPYVTSDEGGGVMKYDGIDKLLVEGRTYFFKFTITEDGYTYRAAWAQGEASQYFEFEAEIGDVKKDLTHFGIFLAELGMTGKLIKVRCYDRQGNDLGIVVTGAKNATVGRDEPIPKDTEVDHTYRIEIEDTFNIALSNRRAATTDKVYMEYTVKESDSKIWQAGAVLSNSPKANFPYLTGMMYFNVYEDEDVDNEPYLVPGAEYLIIFEKKEDTLDVTVQQVYKGQVTFTTFASLFGKYYKDANYVSLWFGDGPQYPVNCVLENFKCYDDNKNNLGVQTNTSGVTITHFGELEDYAGCDALYCDDEDYSMFALYDDKTLKYTENNETTDGTYRIEDNVMDVKMGDAKSQYDYLFQYFTAEDGSVYKRLQSCKVIFDTGKGSAVDTQILSPENGYVVMKPSAPTLEGKTFEGWYTSDGEEYKFDSLQTKSLTLYAKWSDVEYVDGSIAGGYMPYIAVGVAVILLGAAIACGLMIIARGKVKNGEQ